MLAAVLGLAAPLASHAAGLGKLTVLSPLGQPLNAEIEIVSLQAGEEEGLVARLGSPEAFRQAGIEYNPALSGLLFAIERRGGRPVLRLTSTQPVNEPFIDLLVELQWNTGRLVREYTFLLDPLEYKGPAPIAAVPATPAPAQKPAAQPVPAPAAPVVQATPLAPTPAPAAAAATYAVKKGDTLGAIARQHLAPGVSLNQMLIALYRANEDAFIRKNVNLVRAGKILNIPAPEASSTVDPQDADRLVRSHMADFAEYRARLAAAPSRADAATGQRAVTGRIEPKPAAQPPAAAPDQLRLSKADPQKPGAAGSRAAREDDRVAQERAAKEAESRVADLEKNVADLQKLLTLKNQQLTELEKKAGAKPAPEKPAAEAPKPAPSAPQKPAVEAPKPSTEAPKPAAEAPKPSAEPAKPAATAPKPPPATAAKPPAKKGPPPPEPSLIDEFLDNPLALGALGGLILLLAGYGVWAWRRKKATQAKFQDSILGAAKSGGAGTASVMGAPAAAPAQPAAAAAPGASQAPASQPASLEAEEVDPIAEADVYMAYGRDAQAEEILKEALQADPNRVPVQAKLLEIYANRRDAKSFEQIALKLKGLTNGTGPEWDKAAALGRSIDPQNGVYAASGGGAAAAAAPAVAAAAPAPATAPTLDFDLGGAPAQTTAPDISLDEPATSAAAGVDFDLGSAPTPPAAPAPAEKSDFTGEGTLIMDAKEADQTASGGLDFDLGLGGDEKKEAPAPTASAPAPAAPAPPPAPAADASGGLDFDLNLDLGSGGGDKPAAETPAAAPAALDLSAISLDLGSAGEPSAAPAGGGDAKWQEVATKLDLAKAYEEMGDKDGARELLNEVMKDGDAAQKGQAQQLLAKLA